MVDLHCKTKMATSNMSTRSPPPPPSTKTAPTIPFPPRVPDSSSSTSYEHYLRLPDLLKLSNSKEFPDWSSESILKPSLQALEATFRLISVTLSDSRPYSNLRQWKNHLLSLTNAQIELISIICSNDYNAANIPIVNLSNGVLTRGKSSQEVWKLNETTTVVSHTSDASLLPRLSSWDRSKDVASKILLQIECHMDNCPFTLGLGEPNLAGKPSLEYDLIVRPSELHALKKTKGHENRVLHTAHQILELWVCTARNVLTQTDEMKDGGKFEEAADNCWMLEKIWKLLSKVVDLHLLMDPYDFLKLKNELEIRASRGSEAFCFRSRGLMEVTDLCKGLKDKVPGIVGAKVDPNGGPGVQEAVMRLFCGGRESGKVHLLQAFQAVEKGVKEFYFGYKQVMMAVMGSLEGSGNGGMGCMMETGDLLTQMFMDPPYFPSVDAAKTFLGEMIRKRGERGCGGDLDASRCGGVGQ